MTRISSSDGIQRRYLADEVADRLRALILDGDLAPRQRVNELELAERFGISRTPLREAIKMLATEGLLELLPNRGARVAAISEKELDDMLEVVAGLEATAAELACQRISEPALAAIEALHTAMVAAWRAEATGQYFELNRQIHDALMAAADNATLATIYANVSGRIRRARYSASKTPEQWAKAIADHDELVRLLRLRDGQGLAALLRRHVRSKALVIKAAFG